MRVSYAWLKEFTAVPLGAEALAERLLLLGLEVSALQRTGPAFSGVVVGEVLTKEKHPNADRLSCCTVTDGTATYPVVCGAPNVAAGQRVALARVGAVLGPDFKIKKSKIRGAVSEGMICSAKELGLPDDGLDGILVLSRDEAVGLDYAASLGPGDALLDVEVTPNRADCLSHLGLARELAVHFGLTLTPPKTDAFPESGPAPLPVMVADAAACPRYTGRLVAGLEVGPSSDALRRRLESCGVRPINNVVDATNYVLLERGQPMHAFDADTLRGGRLEVRDARAGERLRALDGREYSLTPDDLVIADAAGPVAIAGVMGGEPTGVTAATTRVFLECARFAPGRVRRTARRLGLRTDSSYRFERGIDPAAQGAAAARLASLVLASAGGSAGPLSDTAPQAPRPAVVIVSPAGMNDILGTSHREEAVRAVLCRIALDTRPAKDGLELSIPSWRPDLTCRQDLAEEVGRHLGYDAIPEEASPARLPVPTELPVPALSKRLAYAMAGLGFQEAFNYDFLSERELEKLGVDPDGLARLLNPISEDWAALRPTLLGGLLRSAALNQNRGAAGGRLFEAGRVYWKEGVGLAETPRLAGLWFGAWPERPHFARAALAPSALELKGLLETLLRRRRVSWGPGQADPLFHPKAALTLYSDGIAAGRLGELHPETLRRWDLRGPAAAFELDLAVLAGAPAVPPRYEAVSPFPAVTRDMSLLAERGLPFAELAAVLTFAPVAAVDLVDLYEGDKLPAGKKSWLVRLTLQLPDRTLTDGDIAAAMAKASAACAAKGVGLRA